MKKLLFIAVLYLFTGLLSLQVFAVEIIGTVLSTDIKAFINGSEIPAYNIDGKLAIIVSDLNQYGFKTSYDNNKRKTTVTRNFQMSSFISIPSKSEGLPIGTPVMSVYSSDIRVELDGRIVPAFNVDNRMAIYFSELKEYGTYSYNNINRASYLVLSNSIPMYEYESLTPSGFANGYEFGNYNRFNSYAYINGLENTPIWINASISNIDIDDIIADVDSYSIPIKVFFGTAIDEYGNKWLVLLDGDYWSPISRYENIQNHKLCICGYYIGYSDVMEMPAIEVDKIFDNETGFIIVSELYTKAHYE